MIFLFFLLILVTCFYQYTFCVLEGTPYAFSDILVTYKKKVYLKHAIFSTSGVQID